MRIVESHNDRLLIVFRNFSNKEDFDVMLHSVNLGIVQPRHWIEFVRGVLDFDPDWFL